MTHVGGPTVLIELAGWRILTDPTFDLPGRKYGFGAGTSSTKTRGPAIPPDELGAVDLVLLSHDHHADNLDDAGRRLLGDVPTVLTTPAGARRLAASHVRGMVAGGTVALSAPDRPGLHVEATPARHGPPVLAPAVIGQATGFALRLGDSDRVAVWMTGDTVMYDALRRTAERLDVDVLLLHLGRVRFPQTGPLRYTMDSADGVELVGLTQPRVAVPVHFEGWSHFSEPEEGLRKAFDAASDVRDRTQWLTLGEPREL